MSTDSPDRVAAPDRCKAKRAAHILSLPYPGSFNRLRRKMQKVWNRTEETTEPYPVLDSAVEREAFDKQHILVVPEWGGVSHFGGNWIYSVEKCRTWAKGDRFSSSSS